MKRYILHFCIIGGFSICCSIGANSTHAQETQVIPDGTLPNNTVVTPQSSIYTITAGTEAGNNLFHSFKQFSIKAGERVNFISPNAKIENILVRVTGGNRSEIMGTLATTGGANPNLFLINPSGILFGPKASLNVGGSFVATTANAIAFGNRGFFNASLPNNPALLTVQPSAFLFNQIAAQSSITNQSTAGLKVPQGESLLLLGGNVNLNSGYLEAKGGRVELAGVASEGTVGLVESQNLHFIVPDNLERADVSLTNAKVLAENGGSIAIAARNLNILQGSRITSGVNSFSTQEGNIFLDATGKMAIARSFIRNEVSSDTTRSSKPSSQAVSNTGGIYLKTGSLFLSDGAYLSTDTYGRGSTTGVFVRASGSVSANNSTITSNVENSAVGSTGGIDIKAESLSLNNRTTLSANIEGQGNTVGVFIRVNNFESTKSFIQAKAGSAATNKAGDINIQTGNISLTNGSTLETFTKGQSMAGNVTIVAQQKATFDDSFIFSDTFGAGDGGTVNIKAKTLFLTNGAEILTRTSGKGKGGDIQVHASDSVIISGVNPVAGNLISGLIASSEGKAGGQGGDISVTSPILQVSQGAVLSTRTTGAGFGGNIKVNTNDLELTDGGQFVTSSFSSGNAGNITVNASDTVTISGSDPTLIARFTKYRLELIDNDGSNSGLFARIQGNQVANAGNIEVTAPFISLDKQGIITTETKAGEGGNVTLKARSILLRNGSKITATAGTENAGGNGGNIDINTQLLVSLGSDITANAFIGRGGNIRLSARGLFLTPDTKISASSRFGIDGVVDINRPDTDPSSGLVELPVNLADATQQIDTSCNPDNIQTASSFVAIERGGIPDSPFQPLIADALQVNWVTPKLETQTDPFLSETSRRFDAESFGHSTQTYIAKPTVPEAIVEATGWVKSGNGEISLVARTPKTFQIKKYSTFACSEGF
ncbi:filamentous hemagglutinin N-terminal domain-containing protein [Scytonema sp. NUACC26]|uniref:two-partner secretion domain-containing protein n=1 Tax=Scytonema sp. NUACC26 TaxID=3140176 RepID=UPI0034DCB260